jgi:hypothetical protein
LGITNSFWNFEIFLVLSKIWNGFR